MSIKKEVYRAVRDKLLTETGVETSRLYNSQFDNLDKENVFTFPAAFIEFAQLDYVSNAEGTQEGDARIRIYLGYDSLKTEDLDVLDLMEEVHLALQGFLAVENSTPLVRIYEGQDVNHDVVAVWLMDYTTKLTDTAGNRKNKLVKMQLDEICITPEAEKPRLKEL